MNDDVLTREKILDVTEEVLRRYGPAKATVVDVARALHVSHGSVYRHFASKAALRDAVTARWLARVSNPLAELLKEQQPAAQKLRHWVDSLIAAKRQRAFDDPELFATYMELVEEAGLVVKEHVAILAEQIGVIVSEGVANGEFVTTDIPGTARAILYATGRFHNPIHAAEWRDLDIHQDFEAVWSLLLNGLAAR